MDRRTGIRYENLSDKELDTLAHNRGLYTLRPVAEIGREAVIEELRTYESMTEAAESARRKKP